MGAAPILLFFDDDVVDVATRFQALALEANWLFHTDFGHQKLGEHLMLYEGVSLSFEISKASFDRMKCHRTFTQYQPATARSMISLTLYEHVAGGQYIAPIVRALLSAAGKIAEALSAQAVLWTPADMLSDTDYFVNTVESYALGGVFPVLSTVRFDFDATTATLSSCGLEWFSGQELSVDGSIAALGNAELTQRAVRLVHDIAVNGPVRTEQTLDDIDPNAKIILSPSQTTACVTARIIPDDDSWY